MKTYKITIAGKEIDVVQNEDGSFNKPNMVKELESYGTALKPAFEPICMAMKPLSEKNYVANVLKYGTGGINIDESRVYTEYCLQGSDLSDILNICQLNHLQLSVNNAELKRFQGDTTNVIKSLFSVAENVDMPILEKTLGKVQEDITKKDIQCSEEMLMESINTNLNTFIFGKNTTEQSLKDLKYIILTVLKMITDWKIYNVSAYQLTEVLLTKVKNEVNTREKLGRFPANLLHDNSEEVRECFPESTSGAKKANQENYNHEGKEFVATLGASVNEYEASSGNASRFFKSILYYPKASKSERDKGCEELEYKFRAGLAGADRDTEELLDDVSERFRTQPAKNNHPTVKPIALMEYLIKMVTPKGGIVLDPFAGSGSTLVAAKQNGFKYIGIEMEAEYIKIAEARLEAVNAPLL